MIYALIFKEETGDMVLKEYISALRQEAHRMAAYLERERKEKERARAENKELREQTVAEEIWKESMEDDCPVHGHKVTFH